MFKPAPFFDRIYCIIGIFGKSFFDFGNLFFFFFFEKVKNLTKNHAETVHFTALQVLTISVFFYYNIQKNSHRTLKYSPFV